MGENARVSDCTSDTHEKIAVYFSNGMGNLVEMTPMLRAVRLARPGASLELVIGAVLAEDQAPIWSAIEGLARCYEGELLDQVTVVDRGQPVDTRRWDRVIVPLHGVGGQAKESMAQARGTVGSGIIYDWTSQHEVEHYMEYAYALGYRGPVPALESPMPGDATVRHEPHVLVCNGSNPKARDRRKRWDPARWGELASWLRRWTGLPVASIGGPGDLVGDDCVRDLTALPFGELVRLLRAARLLVTTDTFCMHLAAACGTPIVALFGPSCVTKNRPWTDAPVEIVRSAVDCAPCQNALGRMFQSCEDARCMRELEVGDVMAGVRRLERRVDARERKAA